MVLSGTAGSRVLPVRASLGILAFGLGARRAPGAEAAVFLGLSGTTGSRAIPVRGSVGILAFGWGRGGPRGLTPRSFWGLVVRLEVVPFPFVAIGAFGLRVDVDRRTVNGCLWHGPFRGIPYVGTIGENRTGKGTTFSRTGIRLE